MRLPLEILPARRAPLEMERREGPLAGKYFVWLAVVIAVAAPAAWLATWILCELNNLY